MTSCELRMANETVGALRAFRYANLKFDQADGGHAYFARLVGFDPFQHIAASVLDCDQHRGIEHQPHYQALSFLMVPASYVLSRPPQPLATSLS